MSKAETRRAVRDAVERTILQVAAGAGTVTADDVRRKLIIPTEIDPRIVGTAFLSLMLDGWIEEIGDLHTVRRVAHSRKIRVWRLCCEPGRVSERMAKPSIDLPKPKSQRGLFDEV